jgi:hypothetical protein
MRNGQQAILGVDAVARMDALHIESAIIRRIRLRSAHRQRRGGPLA